MTFSKETIQDIKDAYKRDFDVSMSDEEAEESLTILTDLFTLLARFHMDDIKKEEANHKKHAQKT